MLLKKSLELKLCFTFFLYFQLTTSSSSSPFERARIFRSISPSHRGSHVSGSVCLGRGDPRLCDGRRDCVGGKDEMEEVCGRKKKAGTEEGRRPKAIEPTRETGAAEEAGGGSSGRLYSFAAAAAGLSLVLLYALGCGAAVKLKTRGTKKKKAAEAEAEVASSAETGSTQLQVIHDYYGEEGGGRRGQDETDAGSTCTEVRETLLVVLLMLLLLLLLVLLKMSLLL